MLYILDTADLKAIEHCSRYYPLAGVTTNPSIIAKEKTDFYGLVKAIRSIIGEDKMLHIQTTADKAENMLREAERLKKNVGGNLYLKIPISEEGLRAATLLKDDDQIGVTMTAVFTPQQALISAMAGADFVAPYVNRLDNITGDGVGVVRDIVKLFERHALSCRVLAASFKNVQQVNDVALAGCHSVTVNADLMKQAISHPMTDSAVEGFTKDWRSVYGNKTILDF